MYLFFIFINILHYKIHSFIYNIDKCKIILVASIYNLISLYHLKIILFIFYY